MEAAAGQKESLISPDSVELLHWRVRGQRLTMQKKLRVNIWREWHDLYGCAVPCRVCAPHAPANLSPTAAKPQHKQLHRPQQESLGAAL